MSPPNADVVFVIDASQSMQPCFDALRTHLDKVLQPLKGQVSKVRVGLVAHRAGADDGVALYDHYFLCGEGAEGLRKLYQRGPNDPDPRNEFFTDDPSKFTAALTRLRPSGNEDMLVALDIAADFPFGPLGNTKRVIALFSDEPFKDNLSKSSLNDKIPALSKKLMERHIQLFMAIPEDDAANDLAMIDRSEVDFIEGGDGLRSVDFGKLLDQMGKSISVSALQSTREKPYQRALFGQDRWEAARAISADNRDILLNVGESATLDTSVDIGDIRIQLRWTRAIDLDLHAFFITSDGTSEHVYFRIRDDHGVHLDADEGIGDQGGQNEENISVESLDDIRIIAFATQIYGNGDRFCDYDGCVVIQAGQNSITVPLSAQQTGRWCEIVRIDNQNPRAPRVININRVSDSEPDL